MRTKNIATKKENHRIKGPKEKLHLMKGGFANMTYRDVKRRAISLGMPFPDAVVADFGKLASYVQKSENKPDTSLIDKYDNWIDQQLLERGYKKGDPMLSYQLRLGYIGEDKVGEIKKKKIKGLPRTPKPKREKDNHGFWKGTKKSYTFELSERGYSIERIIRRVTKKFPDANPKSINQWYRAYIREQQRKNEKH